MTLETSDSAHSGLISPTGIESFPILTRYLQAFEYAKHPYSQELEPAKFMKYMKPGSTAAGEPHALAPPMLEIDGKHLISQTPNILLYLGDILGLSGTEPMHKYFV